MNDVIKQESEASSSDILVIGEGYTYEDVKDAVHLISDAIVQITEQFKVLTKELVKRFEELIEQIKANQESKNDTYRKLYNFNNKNISFKLESYLKDCFKLQKVSYNQKKLKIL